MSSKPKIAFCFLLYDTVLHKKYLGRFFLTGQKLYTHYLLPCQKDNQKHATVDQGKQNENSQNRMV